MTNSPSKQDFRIVMTERRFYRNGTGSVRVFTPRDHTLYGFWFPQSLLPSIVSKEVIEQLEANEETVETVVDETQLKLIETEGLNPYHKRP